MQKLRLWGEKVPFQSHKASDRAVILIHQPGSREDVLDHYTTVASFTPLRRRQDAKAKGMRRQRSSVVCSSYLPWPFPARYHQARTPLTWKGNPNLTRQKAKFNYKTVFYKWGHWLESCPTKTGTHCTWRSITCRWFLREFFAFLTLGFFVHEMGWW